MVDGLFRGKREDNGEWVYGYYGQFHNRPKLLKPNSHQIFELSEHAYIGGSCIGGFWRIVIPETVGRLLKIKNIQYCEGDIVEVSVSIHGKKIRGRVMFGSFFESNEDSYTGFYINWCTKDYKLHKKSINYWTQFEDFKIIGNIFDNPELLRED